jgi:hypothetical protein
MSPTSSKKLQQILIIPQHSTVLSCVLSSAPRRNPSPPLRLPDKATALGVTLLHWKITCNILGPQSRPTSQWATSWGLAWDSRCSLLLATEHSLLPTSSTQETMRRSWTSRSHRSCRARDPTTRACRWAWNTCSRTASGTPCSCQVSFVPQLRVLEFKRVFHRLW